MRSDEIYQALLKLYFQAKGGAKSIKEFVWVLQKNLG